MKGKCGGKGGKGSLGKGSLGKGSLGKGRGGDPAPLPAPKTDDELLEDAQNKCRKMRDVCGKCPSNLEEAVQGVKKQVLE